MISCWAGAREGEGGRETSKAKSEGKREIVEEREKDVWLERERTLRRTRLTLYAVWEPWEPWNWLPLRRRRGNLASHPSVAAWPAALGENRWTRRVLPLPRLATCRTAGTPRLDTERQASRKRRLQRDGSTCCCVSAESEVSGGCWLLADRKPGGRGREPRVPHSPGSDKDASMLERFRMLVEAATGL